jgi:hypothetical protein
MFSKLGFFRWTSFDRPFRGLFNVNTCLADRLTFENDLLFFAAALLGRLDVTRLAGLGFKCLSAL